MFFLIIYLKEGRNMIEEALASTLWRIHFERGYGPVIRQNT